MMSRASKRNGFACWVSHPRDSRSPETKAFVTEPVMAEPGISDQEGEDKEKPARATMANAGSESKSCHSQWHCQPIW
jgi:hypothetical protein